MRIMVSMLILSLAAAQVAMAQPCPYIASTLPGDPNAFGGYGLYGFDAAFDNGLLAVPHSPDGFSSPLGIRLIDVTDPEAPTDIAILSVAGLTRQSRVELRGARLWLLKDQFAPTELVEFDISDPLNVPPPTVIASGRISQFDVSGSRLYAMHNSNSVEHVSIYDVSTLGTASIIASFSPFPGGTTDDDFILHNGVLYQSDRDFDSTVRAWSVADPLNPVLLGETFFPGVDLAIRWFHQVENSLIVAGGGPGIVILDASDPNAMVIAETLPGQRSHISSGRVISTTYLDFAGIRVLDVSNPYDPTVLFDAQFEMGPGVDRQIVGGDSGIALVISSGNPFGGANLPPEMIDFGCSIEPVVEEGVCILEDTVIGPEDTMIDGVPLGEANIKVGRSASSAMPATPGFIFAATPAVSATLTIEGVHAINSIQAVAQSHLFIEGHVTTGFLSMTGATGTVNGWIVTDDLEMLDGAALTHDPEAATEAP